MPSGSASARLVGDQLADVVDEQRWPLVEVTASYGAAQRSSVRHVDESGAGRRAPPAGRPPRTCSTSAAVAAKTTRAHRCRTPGGTRPLSSRDRDQVGARADGDPAGVGPAQRGVAGDGRRVSSSAGGRSGPGVRVRSRSSSSTARASSNRSITAWLSLPRLQRGRPASASPPGRPDAVGQVAFGGRAEADTVCRLSPSRSRSSSVRWVACTAVVAGPSTPCSVQQRGRRAAVRGAAGVVLGRLLGQVHVQRRAC